MSRKRHIANEDVCTHCSAYLDMVVPLHCQRCFEFEPLNTYCSRCIRKCICGRVECLGCLRKCIRCKWNYICSKYTGPAVCEDCPGRKFYQHHKNLYRDPGLNHPTNQLQHTLEQCLPYFPNTIVRSIILVYLSQTSCFECHRMVPKSIGCLECQESKYPSLLSYTTIHPMEIIDGKLMVFGNETDQEVLLEVLHILTIKKLTIPPQSVINILRDGGMYCEISHDATNIYPFDAEGDDGDTSESTDGDDESSDDESNDSDRLSSSDDGRDPLSSDDDNRDDRSGSDRSDSDRSDSDDGIDPLSSRDDDGRCSNDEGDDDSGDKGDGDEKTMTCKTIFQAK